MTDPGELTLSPFGDPRYPDAVARLEPYTVTLTELEMGRSLAMPTLRAKARVLERIDQLRREFLGQSLDLDQIAAGLHNTKKQKAEAIAAYAQTQASRRPLVSRRTRNVIAGLVSLGVGYAYAQAGDDPWSVLEILANTGFGLFVQVLCYLTLAELFPTPAVRIGRYAHQLKMPDIFVGEPGSGTDRDFALGYRLAKLRSGRWV